jgi:hypothetical protein
MVELSWIVDRRYFCMLFFVEGLVVVYGGVADRIKRVPPRSFVSFVMVVMIQVGSLEGHWIKYSFMALHTF